MFSNIIYRRGNRRRLRANIRMAVAGKTQHSLIGLTSIRGICYLALLTVLAVLAGCSPGGGPDGSNARPADGGWPLVWEAWRQIDVSYAGRDSLEIESVIGGALESLLALTESDAYPFLSDVGRMRGQPPVGVPPELVDVWRGLVLHQNKWPQVPDAFRTRAVIKSMVAALGDPSARYVPAQSYPEASKNLEQSRAGSYLGIGARVFRRGDSVILDPFEGSPAGKAGIKVGDVLKAVEGRPVGGRSVNELIDMITGPAGTKVKLRLERAGEPLPLDIDVFRGAILLPSVTRQLAPGGIGYIFIGRFRDNTGEQFADALEALGGFDMLALILDLRSNPGGSLDAARQVTASLLPSGSLFLSTRLPGGDREDQRLEKDPNIPSEDEIPMVVLINERTRGEAEAVAAALQDAGRAVIMGMPSFGAGAGYEFVELGDGSAIYLPTVRWYRPSGGRLGNEGVDPDVRVELEAESDGVGRESQFNAAYDYLDALLPHFR